MNLRLANDNVVVLGEPFLRHHYTVFFLREKRIGILPARMDDYTFEGRYQDNIIDWVLRGVVVIFVIGLILIFCNYYIRRCFKKLRNFFKNLKTRVDPIESAALAGSTAKTFDEELDNIIHDSKL